MKKFSLITIVAILILLTAPVAFAQSTTRYLSIPSSGFTPRASEGSVGSDAGYDGNQSGTARFFNGSFELFAPVNLPDGVTVNSMRCGGQVLASNRIRFTLRRNQPQQANVDMATVMSGTGDTGFQVLDTNSIESPMIDNAPFNYYIVAQANDFDVGVCPTCSVGFCRIGYTIN